MIAELLNDFALEACVMVGRDDGPSESERVDIAEDSRKLAVPVGNSEGTPVGTPSINVTELEVLRVNPWGDTDVLFVYDLAVEHPDVSRVEND